MLKITLTSGWCIKIQLVTTVSDSQPRTQSLKRLDLFNTHILRIKGDKQEHTKGLLCIEAEKPMQNSVI